MGYVGDSKKPLEVCATLIVKKELAILGSRNALIDEFQMVKDNISTNKLDFKRLISRTYTPDEAEKAFSEWDANPADFVKIQINFE